MASKRQLFAVIVGCGRLGSLLANRLSRAGHSVVAVDLQEGAFAALDPSYSGFRLAGDATQFAVLEQAKIGHADCLVAATDSDNVNLMVAQVSRTLFSVPTVIARISDPAHTETFGALGVQTVCPTALAADALWERLTGPQVEAEG